MKTWIAILLFCIIAVNKVAFAQVDEIIWQQCYGTVEDDYVRCIEKFGDGYLIGISITTEGTGVSNYHGGADAWMVNIDSAGNVLWERCYGGSNADGPQKIIKIDENYFYLLNWSRSSDGDVLNGRPGEIWIVKINALGEIIWEKSYGGSIAGESAVDALLTADNGLVFMAGIYGAGGDISTSYGDDDIWICKIDSSGTIEWEKTFGNQGGDLGESMEFTSDSNILVIGGHDKLGGMIHCDSLGFSDVWIFEIDLTGDLLNQWCYGGSDWEKGMDITELDDGYAFIGYTHSNDGDVSGFHGYTGSIYSDIWVVKIDFFGNIIWQKCLGGSGSDGPYFISMTVDDGFIIIGGTSSYDGDVSYNHSYSGDYGDIWVVKLNYEGELEWEHCFGGSTHEWLRTGKTVLKNGDYNYILATVSDSYDYDVECDLYSFPDRDAWIVEIKDCGYYFPGVPSIISDKDTICVTVNPVSLLSLSPVPWAWGYEWSVEPEQACIWEQDSLNIAITWNQLFEGQVDLKVRSYNDCGISGWSDIYNLWVYNCLGTDEHDTEKSFVSVYPNPCGTYIAFVYNIPNNEADANIVITDITGKLIETLYLKERSGQKIWETTELENGLYFYILRMEGHSEAGKILINK